MADKIVAAEKNIPAYEISPKWILIYQIVNFLIGFVAYYFNCKFDNHWLLFYYLLLQGLLIELNLLSYFDGRHCKLPSSFKYPGLLSAEDFGKLYESFKAAKNKLECYKFKGKAIPAKHQEKYDSLKSKFDEQCKLRSLCWFKYIFCAPKSIVSEDDANDANSQVDNESSETVDVESVSSSESESETESDFSSNEDKNSDDFSDSDSDDSDSDSSVTDSGDSDVSFIDDKKSIDEKVGEDKKIKTIKSMPETFKLGRNTPKFAKIKNDMFNVNEKTSAEDREVQVAALTIKEEIKNRQIEPTFKKSETTKNVGADKENDEFENLKIQLVEIKAENAKLKSSVEKLFASQTVF